MRWGRVRSAVRRQRPGELFGPLLPDGARRPAMATVAVCAAVTAALGAAFAGQSRGSRVDVVVDGWLMHALAGHQGAVLAVARLGGSVPVAVMALSLAGGCALARRWNGAVLAGVAIPVAGALTEWVLKPAIGRTLDGYLCYPSGHTTGAFAVGATCAVLLVGPAGGRVGRGVLSRGRMRFALAGGALLVAAGVATGVVALGEHYATDAVGGAALSTGVVLGTALVLDRYLAGARVPWARRPAGAAQRAGESGPARKTGSLACGKPGA